MAIDTQEATTLERSKRASLGQVLMKAARLLDEQALARIRVRTGNAIRPAHSNLFPHIDLEGSRLTVIAQRMGLTKQAVGHLVGDLESMGVVERVPDPTDGRAKLVRFTRRNGRSSLFDGLAVLAEFEEELAQELGDETMEALRVHLPKLLDALEASPQSERSFREVE